MLILRSGLVILLLQMLAACTVPQQPLEIVLKNYQTVDVSITWQQAGDVGLRPLINASIEDKQGQWLLDTGSSFFILDTDVATQLGLKSDGNKKLATASGEIMAAVHTIPVMRIGNIQLKHIPALSLDLKEKYPEFGHQIMGVIGSRLLKTTSLELDFPNSRIRFSRAIQVENNSHQAFLRWRNQIPMIRVKPGNGESSDVIFDTGNVGGLVIFPDGNLHQGLVKSGNLASAGLVVRGEELGRDLNANLFEMEAVQFAGSRANRVPIVWIQSVENNSPLADWNASLGMLLLKHCKWIFTSGKTASQCPQRFSLPGGFGLLIKQAEGRLIIHDVLAGSPAEAAGLEPGDLLQTDAETVTAFWGQHRNLTQLVVYVQRSGEAGRRVELQRTHFLPSLYFNKD